MKYLLFVLAIILSTGVFAMPRVNYTKLSNEAKSIGQIDFYKNKPTFSGTINLDGYSLKYSMPSMVRAYDMVPIDYVLNKKDGRDLAIEAVASEEKSKAKGQALYDMTIPGDLRVNIEYLGNISADYDDSNYQYLTPNPKEAAPLDHIPIKRYDFLESSTAKAADCIWFKFKITNTGNTILDPEGFGKDFGEATIIKVDENGKSEWDSACDTINIFERHLNDIYPGESWVCWVQFNTSKYLGWPGRQLVEGNYEINFYMKYKYNRTYNYELNVWGGATFAQCKIPIKVTKDGAITEIIAESKVVDESEKMPIYFDKFEEFMTSFDFYSEDNKDKVINGRMYLQVAPWTENVTLKLILTNPRAIEVVNLPVKVLNDTLKINYNANNPMVIQKDDGSEEPAIIVQAMPGMRSNFQLGPFPEQHMEAEIKEMKDLGVNLIANTSGNWWVSELAGQEAKDHILEPCKIGYRYWYDYLMRKYDMKAIGWSIYPPSHSVYYDTAKAAFGLEDTYSPNPNTYPARNAGIDFGDPIIPKLLAVWSEYTYGRWGDYWFTDKLNKTAVDCEDTWGWMRMDINNRCNLGAIGTEKFRVWLKDKYYTNIRILNKVWGSDFKSFEEIDPDKVNSFVELKEYLIDYNASDSIFHDWTVAMEDLDRFRTQLRMDQYNEANNLIKEFLPTGQMAVRTEGANIIAKGDPTSDNPDERHIYYSQRRDATIYDIVKDSKAIHSYSDYTTIPYTIRDWRKFTRESTEAGVINAVLPTFSGMRDVLLNDSYGRDYKVAYNLETSQKGMMIHVLQAAYPVWQAIYEEGGAPGVIWADYLCDGFVTDTQKKEIKLLSNNFKKMKK